MQPIKAVSVAKCSDSGFLYVVDDKGRLWVRGVINKVWTEIDLPNEPLESNVEVKG